MNAGTSASTEAFLRLHDVRKAFGIVSVLKGVKLEVRKGELLCLVGPSGCGKTTLLRITAGIELSDSGEVMVEGQSLGQLKTADTNVAMVFQDFALYPHLTVFDNIAFGLRARRFPQSEVRARVAELTAALDLEAKLERLPHELSGGEQQRVAIARSLARRPSLLLLDEPMANLDPRLRAQLRADLARLRAHFGVTIVYVTHDQAEAMAAGDRVAVMNDGRILQCATPAEVYRRPANRFVASFFGTPGMNFLPGRLDKEGSFICFEEESSSAEHLRLQIPAPRNPSLLEVPRRVVLGVRPEHITLSGPSADSCSPRALVAAVQFAGHEYHVVLSRDGAPPVVSRAGATALPTPVVGALVGLDIDNSQVLLFDSAGDLLAL